LLLDFYILKSATGITSDINIFVIL